MNIQGFAIQLPVVGLVERILKKQRGVPFRVGQRHFLGKRGVQDLVSFQDSRSVHVTERPAGVGQVEDAVLPGTGQITENKDMMDVGCLFARHFRPPYTDKSPFLFAGRQAGHQAGHQAEKRGQNQRCQFAGAFHRWFVGAFGMNREAKNVSTLFICQSECYVQFRTVDFFFVFGKRERARRFFAYGRHGLPFFGYFERATYAVCLQQIRHFDAVHGRMVFAERELMHEKLLVFRLGRPPYTDEFMLLVARYGQGGRQGHCSGQKDKA